MNNLQKQDMQEMCSDFLKMNFSCQEDLISNPKSVCEKVTEISSNLEEHNKPLRKVGPLVPPKPYKFTQILPQVPQSSLVKQSCEPLYSQRLRVMNYDNKQPCEAFGLKPSQTLLPQPILQRKHLNVNQNCKVTLDNPLVLEQQLEALAHHKKQLEKKGLLLQKEFYTPIPKLSLTSLINDRCVPKKHSSCVYANTNPTKEVSFSNAFQETNIYKDVNEMNILGDSAIDVPNNTISNIYTSKLMGKETQDQVLPLSNSVEIDTAVNRCNDSKDNNQDVPQPLSPVSSSYSELRRTMKTFNDKPSSSQKNLNTEVENTFFPYESASGSNDTVNKANHFNNCQTYQNVYCNKNFTKSNLTLQTSSQESSDYYGYDSLSQTSSTYESIYEPIHPRPSSQLSTRSNYMLYGPYVNHDQLQDAHTAIGGLTLLETSSSHNNFNLSKENTIQYCNTISKLGEGLLENEKESEVEDLTGFLVHNVDSSSNIDSYGNGLCFKCNERVLGENSGCTAMDQIYHISCFTCTQCQANLQGKPFYVLDFKPYCEYDYLQTLEKCSVCMKPILERILRATGKPYHPQCFTCIVCGNSLDGVPFTVDATNQNYCIEDFHRKFAPRCCVCKKPIMPEPGEEETVRVVALDRSFHFECYKCEDCGLLLSSEAEGRGCYPLDDHILCKSCNAKRVQMLTNRMTTEL
ncbi:LIM domain-containing protein C4F6.12-like isoform X1 [Teleopsis dalmanni]|uniref:LIM domain-containing protein C4F6.12-like isoform X1 n=1 Tax=Teleopsis dalmanni TaxID=139649 RepID=UPI0018CE84D1|nr:LIM domain-containing protein C4F6.12-like isoform X1 [Teleopsis dalmanni]